MQLSEKKYERNLTLSDRPLRIELRTKPAYMYKSLLLIEADACVELSPSQLGHLLRDENEDVGHYHQTTFHSHLANSNEWCHVHVPSCREEFIGCCWLCPTSRSNITMYTIEVNNTCYLWNCSQDQCRQMC